VSNKAQLVGNSSTNQSRLDQGLIVIAVRYQQLIAGAAHVTAAAVLLHCHTYGRQRIVSD
jgi:hypothetical protein